MSHLYLASIYLQELAMIPCYLYDCISCNIWGKIRQRWAGETLTLKTFINLSLTDKIVFLKHSQQKRLLFLGFVPLPYTHNYGSPETDALGNWCPIGELLLWPLVCGHVALTVRLDLIMFGSRHMCTRSELLLFSIL